MHDTGGVSTISTSSGSCARERAFGSPPKGALRDGEDGDDAEEAADDDFAPSRFRPLPFLLPVLSSSLWPSPLLLPLPLPLPLPPLLIAAALLSPMSSLPGAGPKSSKHSTTTRKQRPTSAAVGTYFLLDER